MLYPERMFPHATYQQATEDLPLLAIYDASRPLASIQRPEQPGSLPETAHSLIINVKAGEILYLPARWWHHVRQTDLSIALNLWYDIEPQGSDCVWLRLLRGVAIAAAEKEVEEYIRRPVLN